MSAEPIRQANLDVVIITRDEEANIAQAVRSVAAWCKSVYVVDSGSTDKTREIAEAEGATVVHHDWEGYAKQKNWAVNELPLKADWVFILDADEVILPRLRRELIRITDRPSRQVPEAGFYINRYYVFLGKRIRHCGFYPSWNLRFFKRGSAHYEERRVHEHMVVDGPTGYLSGHMEHNDRRGLEVYVAKHNRYSTLEAVEVFNNARRRGPGGLQPRMFGNALQRRRWVKTVVYPWLPGSAIWRFVYSFFFRLGFLDGMTGLRFCLFMTFYEYMISLKLREMRLNAKQEARRAKREEQAEGKPQRPLRPSERVEETTTPTPTPAPTPAASAIDGGAS